jgi:hypothetical protein
MRPVSVKTVLIKVRVRAYGLSASGSTSTTPAKYLKQNRIKIFDWVRENWEHGSGIWISLLGSLFNK